MATGENDHNSASMADRPDEPLQEPFEELVLGNQLSQETRTVPTLQDLFYAVIAALLFELFGGMILGMGAALQHGAKHVREHVSSSVIYLTPFSLGFTLWLSYYFVSRKYRRGFREGFHLRAMTAAEIRQSLSLAILLVFVAIATLAVAHVLAPKSLSGKSMIVQIMKNPVTAWVWMVFALAAPFVEELFYRGFAFTVLQHRYNTRAAVWLVTAWFAGVHLPQIAGDWASIVGITCLSAVVTMIRARMESLSPCILIHFVYNAALVGLSAAFRPAP
jgi:membrane protease YdiL (CAAX protease family)